MRGGHGTWLWTLLYIAAPFIWYTWTTLGRDARGPICRSHSGHGSHADARVASAGAAASAATAVSTAASAIFPNFYPVVYPSVAPPPRAARARSVSRLPPPGDDVVFTEKTVFPLPALDSLALWTPDAPLAGLRGTCWTLRPETKPADAPPDDFLYFVCLGDRVIQVQHPIVENRAVFGTFAGWVEGSGADAAPGAPYVQRYEGGAVCEGFGARSATLTFTCDAATPQGVLRLVSVAEPTVCVYELSLVTAAACH